MSRANVSRLTFVYLLSTAGILLLAPCKLSKAWMSEVLSDTQINGGLSLNLKFLGPLDCSPIVICTSLYSKLLPPYLMFYLWRYKQCEESPSLQREGCLPERLGICFHSHFHMIGLLECELLPVLMTAHWRLPLFCSSNDCSDASSMLPLLFFSEYRPERFKPVSSLFAPSSVHYIPPAGNVRYRVHD